MTAAIRALRSWEIILFCVFTSVICWLANLVNRHVPIPYMDEIFHVPQAQRYCRNDFSYWDPKLTTPPGLYFSSLPFSLITECSIDVLRATNILFCLANVYMMHHIRKHLQKDSTLMSSVSSVLLPVNFFFTFLYYTDPGCIFCLLLLYFFYLKRRHNLAAIAGMISLFFRQTSIVWVFFVACLTLDELLQRHLKNPRSALTQKLTGFLGDSIKNCVCYALVGLTFVVFLRKNGGITLGDKQAHEAVIHFTQIGYFFLFTLLFGTPFLLNFENLILFVDFVTRRPLQILFGSLVMYGLFENFLHVHPYLLSDNRHYTFYLWRRFLSKEAVRQGLIVVYIFVGYSLYSCVRHMKRSWIVLFALCTSITIVPQKLLEFRYFLWPYILLRLHFREQRHQVLAELLSFIAINCMTFYMFLYGTFIWQHDPEHIQRFMW